MTGRAHHMRLRWNDEDEPECGAEPDSVLEESKPPDWAESLQQGMIQLLEKLELRQRHYSLIGSLSARVTALEERVSQPSSGPILVPIMTFEPEPFELVRDMLAVVQPMDDEFMACFFDANVNAGGCNQVEAMENLKDSLLSRFEYLDGQPTEKLGPALVKQLAVLRAFIRRKN
jgi:hypothetical protein